MLFWLLSFLFVSCTADHHPKKKRIHSPWWCHIATPNCAVALDISIHTKRHSWNEDKLRLTHHGTWSSRPEKWMADGKNSLLPPPDLHAKPFCWLQKQHWTQDEMGLSHLRYSWSLSYASPLVPLPTIHWKCVIIAEMTSTSTKHTFPRRHKSRPIPHHRGPCKSQKPPQSLRVCQATPPMDYIDGSTARKSELMDFINPICTVSRSYHVYV